MGLLGIPDPFSDILVNHLEKDVVNSVFSAAMSATIAFLWSSKIAKWFGLRDMATAMYLSLQQQVEHGNMALAVPKELLAPDNQARFQTEWKK